MTQIKGNPKPEIEWSRSGVPVKFLAEDRYEVKAEGAVLEISSAGLLDTARFKCSARNEAGISSLSYAIEVQIPPKITSQNLLNDGKFNCRIKSLKFSKKRGLKLKLGVPI